MRFSQCFQVTAVAALAAVLAACGAGDRLSGAVDPAAARCPTFSEIAPNFQRLLQEDRFSGLRSVLEEDLGRPLDALNPNGPTRLTAVIGVVLEVIRAIDVPGFRQVLLDGLRATNGGSLLTQALGLFKYLDGQLGCPTGTTCDHYALVDKLRLMLTSGSCTQGNANLDARTLLSLLARLVKHPRLPELLDLAPRLLRNPTFKSVLDGFRFDGCGEQSCEQEAGFASLVQILLNNVLVSPLPWSTIRDLLRQVGFDTPEISQLLTIAEDLLTEHPASAELDVLTPLRVALRCSRIVDPEHVISKNLYRILALEEVSFDGLLGGIDSLLDIDPMRLGLRLVAQALDYFRGQALNSFRTLQVVLDVLLAPAQAKRVVPALIALVEGGVLPELTNLIIALTDDCANITPP